MFDVDMNDDKWFPNDVFFYDSSMVWFLNDDGELWKMHQMGLVSLA